MGENERRNNDEHTGEMRVESSPEKGKKVNRDNIEYRGRRESLTK